MPMHRRDLNRAALCLALGAWSLPRSSAAQADPTWASDPFTLGVASGMPRPDGVVLWTRLAPLDEDDAARAARPPVRVHYEIFADEALRRPVARGEQTTDAQRAFSVHVQARGLAPQRDYWYRFSCGSAVSPVGRTRTAPAADAKVSRLRLALASCQNYEHGFFAAHREIARQPLDFVLFVGDYIYEGSNPSSAVRRHAGGVPHTLEDYRARHALYKRDADLQAAHAAHPWVLTWDDHEVVNDYADDREPAPGTSAQFLRRRAAAYRAYFEHMPLALEPQGASMRIHDRFAWGQLADIWTLDCRQYRSHHACPNPQMDAGRVVGADCVDLRAPDRTLLGAAQERWLAEGLRASGARWKLLAQSTQVSSTGHDTPQGRQIWTDGWDGYPLARERLLKGIADAGTRNVLALGGDVHRFVAADLRVAPNDAASRVVASEIVGGSIASRGASRDAMARMQRDNPDVVHARGDERGYALLDVSRERVQCEFRATPTPAAQGAVLGQQALYVVEEGRAGVVPG